MDRRDFLKTTGLVAAATSLGGISSGGNNAQGNGASAMRRNFKEVGLLGYGCMRWPKVEGKDGKQIIDQEEVNRLVDEAIANGVNYFDAAPVYLGGECERATAEALSRHPRSEWLLATKLSNFSNWTYDDSVKMYRRSLEIFKTDHIDYYLLHSISGRKSFDTRFGDTGIMDFLLKERSAGHICNLGFSFHGDAAGMEELLALHDKYHWDFIQIQMNYLDWKVEDVACQLYEAVTAKGIPVIVMEPLRGGALSSIPAVLATELKAAEPDKSVASWAFRFAGSFPNVLTVLSGMTYREHLQDNLNTFCGFKPLTGREFELLEHIAEEISKTPLIRCTACHYCMPCQFGIDIPGIFKFYNDRVNEGSYLITKEQKDYARQRRRFLASYDKAVGTLSQADHCISCGLCAKACPQRIPIPTELRKIDEYIEKLKRG